MSANVDPSPSTATGDTPAQVAPQPAPRVPASRGEVALTPAWRSKLEAQNTVGWALKEALTYALAAPVIVIGLLATTTKFLSRLVRWVPFLNFLVPIYGMVITVGGGLLAAVFIAPVVFLAMIPNILLRRRPKVRQDLDGGTAVHQAGTFRVEDRKTWGIIVLDEATRLSLDSVQLKELRPRLHESPEGLTLAGTVDYVPHTRTVLDVAPATA